MPGIPSDPLPNVRHGTPVGPCNRIARPDLFFALPLFSFLLEFDEDGPKGRTEESERKRLRVIQQWNEEVHALSWIAVCCTGQLRRLVLTALHWTTGGHRQCVWKPAQKKKNKCCQGASLKRASPDTPDGILGGAGVGEQYESISSAGA